ncbi:MAG: hypothetical protein H6729_16360 [Deltaproteobacteria bacterium]|nr:hypothetical protein [Deltaproteobacteria bacterium]
MTESKTLLSYLKTHRKLSLVDTETWTVGEKIRLALFNFVREKLERFTFVFSHVEDVHGRLRRHCTHAIHGQSPYLDDMPLYVSKVGGDVRSVWSSDLSEIFLDRPTTGASARSRAARPSPTESATGFDVGTRRKGGNGRFWTIQRTAKGVKRWVQEPSTVKKPTVKKPTAKKPTAKKPSTARIASKRSRTR